MIILLVMLILNTVSVPLSSRYRSRNQLILHKIDTDTDDMISKMLKQLLVNGDPSLSSLQTLGIVSVPHDQDEPIPADEDTTPVFDVLEGTGEFGAFIDSLKVVHSFYE